MKVTMIISEYDPFHSGHRYLTGQAASQTGEPVVSLMSGCFLQRGLPSILDKYDRAEAAVLCGCAAVFELPVYYATSSARDFAEGAVRLAGKTGVVDHLAFGVESADLSLLQEIARILADEPEAFRETLRQSFKDGHSYPAAREKALLLFFPGREEQVSRLLRQPNHILALEYLRAIYLFAPEIRPLPVLRSDHGYHSHLPKENVLSASGIRELLSEGMDISSFIPECLHDYYQKKTFLLHPEERLAGTLNYLLLRMQSGFLDPSVSDFSESLLQRVKKLRLPLSYEALIDALKEKNETRTRICRALIHLLLNIREDVMVRLRQSGASYLNLLALSRSSSGELKELLANANVNIINKKADFRPEGLMKALWETDCFASMLYAMLRNEAAVPEETRKVRIVD